MRFALLATLAVIGTALTSCQTITPEERRAADQQTCARFGFRPGTDAMARCLLDLDLDRRADSRALRGQMDRDLFYRPVVVERRIVVER